MANSGPAGCFPAIIAPRLPGRWLNSANTPGNLADSPLRLPAACLQLGMMVEELGFENYTGNGINCWPLAGRIAGVWLNSANFRLPKIGITWPAGWLKIG